ncbi:MAG TPA: enoyl-CoA hydratase-related protein, partial [Acidimicrobiia bacterium]|nr:enoyl-CoA hydratase-related protein [Acidimicrobiia bacterium]
RIGHQAAAYYLLTGDWLSAEEACRRGLVWKVCPPESLLDEARSVAARIASAPVANLQASKRLIRAARADAVEAANERELAELAAVTRRLIG